MQTARNHQVQHQPEIAFQANRDSLADPPQFAHAAALHTRKWRLYGPKQKRARQPHPLDRLPNDPKLRQRAAEFLRGQGKEELARELEGQGKQ